MTMGVALQRVIIPTQIFSVSVVLISHAMKEGEMIRKKSEKDP